MRVGITGGAGFVGRHFAKHYADLGWNVTIIDNLVSGIQPALWPFRPVDIYKITWKNTDCRLFFKHHKAGDFDLIIHCAAIVGGRLKIEGDPLAVATDLSIDAEFFNWVVRGKLPKQVVYFSSSAVYPVELQTERSNMLLNEALVNFNSSRIAMPDQTYGFAKLAGEYLAQFAAQKYGLNVVIYRPFSGYGEDQSLDYPFPSIIRRVAAKEDPIVVWGSGRQTRDFIHISDVIGAVEASREKMKPGEVLNLGTGWPVTFSKLAEIACRYMEHTVDIRIDSTKPEGVFARVCDPAKLQEFYRPSLSLEEGVARAVDFMLDRELVTV
jgi:GDP-L-fucose synthase